MNPSTWNRRQILNRCGMGMGAVGLAPLLNAAAAAPSPLAPKVPPQRATAKQAIHIFLNGGPSHVDTFDPKPLLHRYQGRPLPVDN